MMSMPLKRRSSSRRLARSRRIFSSSAAEAGAGLGEDHVHVALRKPVFLGQRRRIEVRLAEAVRQGVGEPVEQCAVMASGRGIVRARGDREMSQYLVDDDRGRKRQIRRCAFLEIRERGGERVTPSLATVKRASRDPGPVPGSQPSSRSAGIETLILLP